MKLDYPPKWKRRFYQEPVWDYLSAGGRHVELIWHRRAGKDEVALYHTACEMLETPANYWHMLPKGNQVRKAIWEAVNPRTGVRRVDEVFIPELFEKRDTDMLVKCKHNASTWQCLGSDNFEGAIGSTPKGIVYSEWALANPSARGYLRPIIAENKGWQIFITTPRGKNHAYSTYNASLKNPLHFTQKLSVHDTGMLTPVELMEELLEYVSTYGDAMGLALYEQEYECSWDAAIMGAYYSGEFARMDREGRIHRVEHNPNYPVHVAMDIGRKDSTAMWFFQNYNGRVYILEFHMDSNRDPKYYMGLIAGRDCQVNIVDDRCEVEWGSANEWDHHLDWEIGNVYMPHDAAAKNFSTLKTAEEQFAAGFGWGHVEIVPKLSLQDGINATRLMLGVAEIDTDCEMGIEGCRAYHREWDDERKRFRDQPEHDWASDIADAIRYLAIAWSRDKLPAEKQEARYAQDRTFDEMLAVNKKRRLAGQQ